MGKDKNAKAGGAAVPAAPPPTLIGLNGKPLIARGHKQKGAGTVIVDKGPIITSDGIVLKAHERLPTQLLQEYCQREKRPAPRYQHNPPGNRYNVLIADAKNSKNDLNFCPVHTSFESDKVAKDMSALLALFHFQKTIPLERKLPEPYCTTWVEMLAADKGGASKSAASKAPAGGGAATVSSASLLPPEIDTGPHSADVASLPAPLHGKAAYGKQGKVPATVAIPVIDRATADWLCVQCNTQNFATLANGVSRTKCFKCQFPKSDTCELVVRVAAASVKAPAATVSSSFASTSSASNGTVATSAVGLNTTASATAPVNKKAPNAIVGLRAAAPTVSKAEIDRDRVAAIAARNKKRSYFDALRRANKPPPVLLSPNMKKLLEQALGIDTGASPLGVLLAGEAESGVVSIEGLAEDLSAQAGALSDEERGDSALWLLAHDSQLLLTVARRLQVQGFTDFAIAAALRAVAAAPLSESVLDVFDADLVFEQSNSSSQQQLLSGPFIDACLEFLCLQLDDQSLPQAFDARANEQHRTFEVVKKSTMRMGQSDRILSEELGSFGWTAHDCAAALGAASELGGSGNKFLDALLVLHDATLVSAGTESGPELEQSLLLPLVLSAESEALSIAPALGEAETLQAIFGDQLVLTVGSADDGAFAPPLGCLKLVLTLDSDRISKPPHVSNERWPFAAAPTTIEMWVHPCMRYPARPALLLLRNSALSPHVLLSLQLAIWVHARGLCSGREDCHFGEGEASGTLFQVASFFESSAAQLASGGGAAPATVTKALESMIEMRVRGIETWASSSAKDGTIDGCMDEGSKGSSSLISFSSSTSTSFASSSSSKSSSSKPLPLRAPASKERRPHPFWTCGQPRPGLTQADVAVQCERDPLPQSGRESRVNVAKYSTMLTARKSLPAWAARGEFLRTILAPECRGMVVTGETGCGKTTQVPQFLAECDRGCRIVVAQPRRLAAVGVASRVADEMAVPIGDEVGYMVRGDSQASKLTRLVFCTYGVLLRRLQADPLLDAVDYVVLDEVHERGLDSDFALALLVSAIQRGSKLKIVLMSATISTDKFATYLGEKLGGHGCKGSGPILPGTIFPAPVLSIPGFTFPVREFYKGDFETILRPVPDGEAAAIAGCGPALIGGRRRKGELDYDLLTRLVISLAVGTLAPRDTDSLDLSRASGSVLVFMPGVPEISRLISLLSDAWPERAQHLPQGCGNWDSTPAPILKFLALHGNLSPHEQRQVFEPCRRGELKIVVATNVAEASVTIPDVTVVVDSCRVKEMDYDAEKQMSALVMKLASQDSLRQRRGRAGRVSAGRCFRCITKHTFSGLPPHSVPEMLRAPLDRLVLQIKAMELPESVQALLRRCPDPPSRSAVSSAQISLSRIQALDADDALTPLGRHLAALPCDPKVGRLLLFGCLLRVAYPASAVAAFLTSRSPFLSAAEPEARARVNAARSAFAKSSPGIRSDHLVLVAALEGFSDCAGQGEKRRFCKNNALSFDRMQEVCQLQSELLEGMVSLGFIDSVREGLQLRPSPSAANANSVQATVVAAALCAGLYPQLAKIIRPPKRFADVMGSALEKDVQGRELKFFIPMPSDDETGSAAAADDAADSADSKSVPHPEDFDIDTRNLLRVFIHPSSVNFDNARFQASPFVLYGERQLATNASASSDKAYIRDTTEVTAFPLLFFGGKLEAQYSEGTVTIDSWIKFSAPGRLVALVQALRRAVDALLLRKIADPSFNLGESVELAACCKLLAGGGM